VAASDAAGSAGADAVTEKLAHFGDIAAAFDNCLYIYAIAPASVTGFVLEVWVNPLAVDGSGNPITGVEKWCRLYVSPATLAQSSVVAIRDLPPGEVKVLVKSYAGSGSIKICTSKSM
jgi:hypothetical protein